MNKIKTGNKMETQELIEQMRYDEERGLLPRGLSELMRQGGSLDEK